MLFVSHDRHFLAALSNRVLELTPEGVHQLWWRLYRICRAHRPGSAGAARLTWGVALAGLEVAMHAVQVFELVIAMLFAIIALHYLAAPAEAAAGGGAARRRRRAWPSSRGCRPISLDPELVLVIFLPPLLMDGAWFIALRAAAPAPHRHRVAGHRRGGVHHRSWSPWWRMRCCPRCPGRPAPRSGAIVSPPDAVSARAVLQRVRLPRRLVDPARRARACSTMRPGWCCSASPSPRR